MDETARDAYQRMAAGLEDEPDLEALLRKMAADESEHIGWWSELADAWDRGLLPDIVNEPETLATSLDEMLESMRGAVPKDTSHLSPRDIMTIATKMEFYMLDPCFDEFLELMEPAISSVRHEEYTRHIDLLVSAIQQYFDGDSLSAFLARVLQRTWRDSRALATCATRDSLTGLQNRSAFNGRFRQWTAWAARYGRPLSVMLIDVDNLKALNDTWGHAVGDHTLVAVADALLKSTRASDFVARYGGDEFAILAPEADDVMLRQLSERVLETVRAIRGADDEDLHVTVSIGTVIASDEEGSAPRNLEELLAAADQALYAAKESGRDRAAGPVVMGRT
jgi:diguanylate cyclase (GGDEF)-like protein